MSFLSLSSKYAEHLLQKFQALDFKIPYTHANKTEERKYTLNYRPALPALLDVLEDPDLHGKLVFYPERRYVRNPLGGNMRVWSELETGDDWWDLQVRRLKIIINLL